MRLTQVKYSLIQELNARDAAMSRDVKDRQGEATPSVKESLARILKPSEVRTSPTKVTNRNCRSQRYLVTRTEQKYDD